MPYSLPDINTQDDFLLVLDDIGTLYEQDVLTARNVNRYAREIRTALNNGSIIKAYKIMWYRPKPNAEPLEAFYRLTEEGREKVIKIKAQRRI